MQQPEQTSVIERLRGQFNIFALIVSSMACTLQVFLHKRIGERAIGLRGVLGGILIGLWGLLFPREDPRGRHGRLGGLGGCRHHRHRASAAYRGYLWGQVPTLEVAHHRPLGGTTVIPTQELIWSASPPITDVLPRWSRAACPPADEGRLAADLQEIWMVESDWGSRSS